MEEVEGHEGTNNFSLVCGLWGDAACVSSAYHREDLKFLFLKINKYKKADMSLI